LKNKNTNKRTIDKFYVRLIFKIRQYNYIQIDIPLSCPSCGGKMYSVSYESVLPDLKKRSWQVCKECNFERNSEDFKKSIFCV
jgi:C4-type Zn-finger protein